LFVSHPLQTQAVTYIVQRLASLATFFCLLCTYAYLQMNLASLEGTSSWKPRLWYSLSLFAAFLAMKTKEISFPLPVMILFYEYLFFNGKGKTRILRLVPFFLTMTIIPINLIGLGKPIGEMVGDVSQAMKVGTSLSPWDYLFTQFRVMVTYLRLLLLPIHQNLDYDYPVFHSFFHPQVLFSFLILLSVFGISVFSLVRSRRPGSSHLRLIAYGVFWFFAMSSVESSIIPIADVIFEHRMYLPSAGFFIAVSCLTFHAASRLREKWQASEKAAIGLLMAVVVLLSGLTFRRNLVWQTEVGLWEDVIRQSPRKARPDNNLGSIYGREGNHKNAFKEFSQAIEQDPSNAVYYSNRARSLEHLNDFGGAIRDFTKAILLGQDSKGEYQFVANDYNGRGIAYGQLGNLDQSIADFTMAISLAPDNGKFYFNRGVAYAKRGETGKALMDFGKGCAIGDENSCRAMMMLEGNHSLK
jgi:tetratricopeptide (TPR) repeat protein